MKVHHLSCGTMCPRGRSLIEGVGSLREDATMVCHCLLIETNDGLVLVDAGLGTHDVDDATGRLGSAFVAVARPRLRHEDTALRQIEALGFKREDVRHIVPTHLDLDHAGGLSDFPDATVHIFGPEHRAATERPTRSEQHRYRAPQLEHDIHWQVYTEEGDRWFELGAVRGLHGLGDDVLLIPLLGHSRGHVGVAVQSDGRWLLHAGDAYFHHVELRGEPAPAGLRFFQRAVAFDNKLRVQNQRRLVELVARHGNEVSVFSAHDKVELERMQRS